MPVEPPPSSWRLGTHAARKGEDLVGIGADLEPGTILAGYRAGLFPMGVGAGGAPPMGWWSPDPRGILLPAGLRVSRSLRRSRRRFEIRVDTAFVDVVRACAEPSRDGGWITEDIVVAYTRLHRLGWAHSVEAWMGEDLVGGLYGLAIGGLFAGESMFHVVTDASKAALAGLVDLLLAGAPTPGDRVPRDDPSGAAVGGRLIDVQWCTPHLASLGVVAVPRREYLRRLRRALMLPLPPAFA